MARYEHRLLLREAVSRASEEIGMARAHMAVVAAAWLALPVGASAGESPFVGTWKLNAAKSPLAHDTLSFVAARRGRIRAQAAHQAYTFRADGRRYHGPFRYTVVWSKIDARRWRVVWEVRRTVVATELLAIAPDGATLTSTTTGRRADGSPYEDSTVYERVAGGGDGLLGTWRSTKFGIAGFTTVDLAPLEGGFVLTLVDSGAASRLKLDGSDHPLTGPQTPPGLSLSARAHGARTLQLVEKRDAIPIYVGTLSVSEDARTLTLRWKPALVDEPLTAVFDRS